MGLLLILPLVLFLVSAWVVAEAWVGRAQRQAALTAQALIAVVTTLALVVYVVSEDSYRGTGASRWEAYDTPELTVAATLLGTGVFFGSILGIGGGRGSQAGVGLGGLLASVLLFLAFLANSLN